MYTKEQLALLDLSYLPKHICVVMDGNRRWARKKKKNYRFGHLKGVDAAIEVIQAARFLGINTVTAFAFSTENWNRSSKEIHALMSMFRLYLFRMRANMIREGIRFHTIGNLSGLSRGLIHAIERTKEETAHCKKLNLVVAINYGGRDEIRRAVIKLVKDYREKNEDIVQLTESEFASYLDTANWADPDLLIRTSGEQRISNFLLWQISYSELYITDVLWPDFNKEHLIDAIVHYQKRERRLGI